MHETPQLPTSQTEIYLDIEGLPVRNFQYLIGIVIKDQAGITEQHFWANSEEEEAQIFQEFLNILRQHPEFTLFHYGNYEARYLKKMMKSLDEPTRQYLEKVLESCCNVLSFFYSHIYLPTYTNGLKDVAKLVGFTWSDKKASGLQSTIWRKQWEETHQEELKRKLIQYNQEDCYALMKVKDLVHAVIHSETKIGKKTKIPEIADCFKRVLDWCRDNLFHT